MTVVRNAQMGENYDVQVIDDGYADTKSLSQNHPLIITPSYVTGFRPQINVGFDTSVESTSRIVLDTGSRKYLVGEAAVRQDKTLQWNGSDDKHRDESFDILVKAHLGMLNEAPISRVKMVMGLPVNKFMDQSRSEWMRQRVVGQHVFTIHTHGQPEPSNKVVIVDEIDVKPQPHGTLCNIILDDNGKLANKDFARQVTAISDIGGGTHNLYVVDALEPLADFCDTTKSGMYMAYLWVQDYIQNELGITIADGQMQKVIQDREIRGYDLSQVIDVCYKKLAAKIITELRTKWDSGFAFIDNIVFTGGGAKLLRTYLQDEFRQAMFCDRATNPEGLLKSGIRKWRRG